MIIYNALTTQLITYLGKINRKSLTTMVNMVEHCQILYE